MSPVKGSLSRSVASFTFDLDDSFHDFTYDTGDEMVNAIRHHTPVDHKREVRARDKSPRARRDDWGENLRESIHHEQVRQFANRYSIKVVSHKYYASFVEDETPPYVIRPKKPGGFLRIPIETKLDPTAVTGRVKEGFIFVKEVRRKGRLGHHMFRKGSDETATKLIPRADRMLHRLAERHGFRTGPGGGGVASFESAFGALE